MNHQLLLKKLSYAEIRGIANNLISSYLSDRHQAVKTNDKLSQSLSLYINGLLNNNTEAEIICFADDTVLLTRDKNIEKPY